MKIGIVSLGCSKNLVDSELILGLIKRRDEVEFVDNFYISDLIIINTCGFILSAKEEALDNMFKALKEKNEDSKIVVCGCFIQRYKKELEKEFFGEIDAFISLDEYDKFGEILNKITKTDLFFNNVCWNEKISLTNPNFEYIKIAEGCNNNCAFCAIPLIRGKLVSKQKEKILDEIRMAVSQGKQEIILISQDTTAYGVDFNHDYNLTDLIKEALKIDGYKFIRILYMYPDDIDDELINIFKDNDRLIPYFDIPLQHVDNSILKSMNRRGSYAKYSNLIEKIRREIPDSILRTTFIVGFPAESDEQFNLLLEFIEKYPFDNLGAFTYSNEDDTEAASFKNQVDEDIKKIRLEKLMLKQKEILGKINTKKINNIYDCFIEGYNLTNRMYKARPSFSAPDDVDSYVYFKPDIKLEKYSLVRLKIVEIKEYDYIGVLV